MTWFWLGGTTQGVAGDDSAELLRRLRLVTRRPESDRDLTLQRAYTFLTDAQVELVYNLSAHIPDILKGAPVKLTTSDNGLTYNFPSDPLGHIEVYSGPYTDPLIEAPLWSASGDYTREGTKKIRMNGNVARTFADGPYARYIVKPGVIDATSQPTLQPPDIRRVLPWKAAELWAQTGGMYDPTPYRNQVQKMLWGDPESAGDVGIIPAYKVQHQSSGMDGGVRPWWRSGDLT
jgi:hypothetical protein